MARLAASSFPNARSRRLLAGLLASGLAFAIGHRTEVFPPFVGVSSYAIGIVGDHLGLVWIVSTDGVFRFDGGHYHKIPGFPFRDAQYIAVDPVGRVWVGGTQGLARYFESRWTVELEEPVQSMALTHDGLWVDTGAVELIRISGKKESFTFAKPTGALVADRRGVVWFPCGENVCSIHPPDLHLETMRAPVAGQWRKVVPGNDGQLWLSSNSAMVSSQGFRLRTGWMTPSSIATYLDPVLSPQGTVWLTRGVVREAPGLKVWSRNHTDDWCSWFLDEKTRWFCAGPRIGRSRLNRDWQAWTGGKFVTVSPNGIVLKAGLTPLLMTDRGVHELQPDGADWERSAKGPRTDITRLGEDGFGGYWVSSREEGLYRAGPDFAILERFHGLCFSEDTFRGFLRDGSGRMWLGGKDPGCFFEVTGGPHHWMFQRQTLQGDATHVVALHTDSTGRPWVGYQEGIAYLDDQNVWRAIRTSERITFVREFVFDGDDSIWISHRRPGFFTRLRKSGRGDLWSVERFPGERFEPLDTYDIHRDSRGWIWRGTSTGLRVARPGHYEPSDWLRVDKSSGLASESVNLTGWSEDDQGYIWVAGASGVTRFKPSQDWFDAPHEAVPMVTRMSVDGVSTLDPERMPTQLPHEARSVEIDLSSLDAAPFRSSKLRYRLEPGDNRWHDSAVGSLQFPNLPDGRYMLEAAYTGEGPVHVMRFAFIVGHPATKFLLPAIGITMLALTGVALWWRRDWVGYWVEKPLFLMRNRIDRGDDGVTAPWNNHVGRTFANRYQILQMISRGGFAVTYRARDLRADRDVAVKVLHRAPGQESWVRHRFAHEIAAMMTLSHPGVVRLLDSWISKDGEPCLAMEFLEGPTLRKVLAADGSMLPVRAGRLAELLGSALGAIHSRGIVHRDLKPENIMVLDAGSAEERPVIIDFGTSAARGPEHDLEFTTSLTGSLAYLAPERLNRQYSPASDVFSLGVILLEVLTGKRPADFPVAPGNPEFVKILGTEIGVRPAALLVLAFEHQPLKRPDDVAGWTSELARALRITGDRPSI